MFQEVSAIKVDIVTWSATLQRMGGKHAEKAKHLHSRCRNEPVRIKREANSDKKKGIKSISRAIGDPLAKPLMYVTRGRETPDGGKVGGIPTDAQEINAIVTSGWKKNMITPRTRYGIYL